jgi:hypothetical protein
MACRWACPEALTEMRITLATETHDAGLRRLCRELPMPGWIRLAFTREPSWFLGQEVDGHCHQTLVAEDDTGAVVACGCRSIRRVYVNGTECDLGYLGALRSLPASRRAGGLARGYRFLRELHADGRTPAYLTAIVEDNAEARALLTSRRAGLPCYLDQGRFITSALNLRSRRPPRPLPAGLELRTGTDVPVDQVLAFLRREGPARQFFPVLDAGSLGTPRLRDFSPADFHVACSGSGIVGVTATWDQRRYKQALVTGYAPAIRLTRPCLNGVLRLAGYRPLPRPGAELPFCYAAFICVRGQAPEIFAALLEQIHARQRDSAYHYVVVSLHETDPLRQALRRFLTFNYASRLYLACWDDGRGFCDGLDPTRVPHVEPALL